jgi:hypothetical protein
MARASGRAATMRLESMLRIVSIFRVYYQYVLVRCGVYTGVRGVAMLNVVARDIWMSSSGPGTA